MKMSEFRELASFYGYDIKDVSEHPLYKERKGRTYGIVDRRNGVMVATYAAANPKLKNFFNRYK